MEFSGPIKISPRPSGFNNITEMELCMDLIEQGSSHIPSFLYNSDAHLKPSPDGQLVSDRNELFIYACKLGNLEAALSLKRDVNEEITLNVYRKAYKKALKYERSNIIEWLSKIKGVISDD